LTQQAKATKFAQTHRADSDCTHGSLLMAMNERNDEKWAKHDINSSECAAAAALTSWWVGSDAAGRRDGYRGWVSDAEASERACL